MRYLAFALCLTFACAAQPTDQATPTPPADTGEATPNLDAAHGWGYLGPGAPAHWGEIKEAYSACAEGEFQSPIDLSPIAKADVDALRVDYKPDELRINNNGHTVQVNHKADSTLYVDDHAFKLLQYHLHSPSEHTEAGRPHALELHLVHQDEHGHYAVLAVFIDAGEDTGDPGLWSHLPQKPDDNVEVFAGVEVNPGHFLPSKLTHYQYHGSLTTPPCTETVTWNVLTSAITMSPERIENFRELYAANARPVQPRASWCLAPHVIGDPDAPDPDAPYPDPEPN